MHFAGPLALIATTLISLPALITSETSYSTTIPSFAASYFREGGHVRFKHDDNTYLSRCQIPNYGWTAHAGPSDVTMLSDTEHFVLSFPTDHPGRIYIKTTDEQYLESSQAPYQSTDKYATCFSASPSDRSLWEYSFDQEGKLYLKSCGATGKYLARCSPTLCPWFPGKTPLAVLDISQVQTCQKFCIEEFPGYSQQPTGQLPYNQQPGYQQPGYQRPGYQQPGYQQPGYQQPGYQRPGYQRPGYPGGNNQESDEDDED